MQSQALSRTSELRLRPELNIQLEHSAVVVTPGKHRITQKGVRQYGADGKVKTGPPPEQQLGGALSNELLDADFCDSPTGSVACSIASVSTAAQDSTQSTPYGGGGHSRNSSMQLNKALDEQGLAQKLEAVHEVLGNRSSTCSTEASNGTPAAHQSSHVSDLLVGDSTSSLFLFLAQFPALWRQSFGLRTKHWLLVCHHRLEALQPQAAHHKQ